MLLKAGEDNPFSVPYLNGGAPTTFEVKSVKYARSGQLMIGQRETRCLDRCGTGDRVNHDRLDKSEAG